MDTTQISLQRQLADLIANKANLNEIRLVIAQGAKVNLPVVQGKPFGFESTLLILRNGFSLKLSNLKFKFLAVLGHHRGRFGCLSGLVSALSVRRFD